MSELYYPVDVSTGYYMTNIAEYLAAKGLNVNVLTSSLSYTNTGDSCNQFTRRAKINKVNIFRYKPLFKNKNNSILRVTNALYMSILLAWNLYCKSKGQDKVLSVTNPVFLILFIPITCSFKKLDYTLLVHDVFPENLRAIKKGKLNKLFFKFLKSLFDKAYSFATRCIVIGRDMEKVVLSKGVKSTCFIPIWSQEQDVYPREKSETRLYTQLELSSKFVFQFAGNLGLAQGIQNLLLAISEVKNPSAHFLFIGEGALSTAIDQLSKHNTKITHIGYQKRSTQEDFLNTCDVAIVTLSEGMLGLGVPSKSYNILAAGKPILLIADSRSEIAQLINEHDVGWIVEPGKVQELSSVIESIASMDKFKLIEIGKKCRLLAEQKFSKEQILNQYYELLK